MVKSNKRSVAARRAFSGTRLECSPWTLLALTTAVALSAGCSGSGDGPGGSNDPVGSGGTGAGTGGTSVGPGVDPNNPAGTAGVPNVVTNPPVDPAGNPVDPGRVGLHRLNNTEYNNTVRDLVGSASAPASAFLAEEGLTGFDNTASALGMTPAQFEAYFGAAGALADEAFLNAAWMAANVTCQPTVASDPCVTTLLGALGQRIYRRPMSDAEKALALAVYDADFARSADGSAALKEMLRAMLASASFLYRVEVPADPLSVTPQALNGFEVASRLSYLHWSTMPDDALFQAAAAGGLLDAASIEAQVDRMLADPRASEFLANFGGQWLDIRDMIGHSATPSIFPTFSEELRSAMITEGQLWFGEFVQGDRPLSEWFTAEFNYVNDTLATHYGYTPPGAGPNGFARVETAGDARMGFLGQGHFLTTTSFPGRTSPTLRAVWVLENLMCSPPPQPPPIVPQLEEAAEPNAGAADPTTIVNVKARLEAHRQNPACFACHQTLDPLGLALENFDGIGQYRTTYSNGEPIDASGTLNGTAFDGLPALAAILAADARFVPCVAEKLFTYALGRGAEPTDDPYLAQINTQWAARGALTVRNLLKTVATNDTFRFSRGEAQ